MHSLYEPEHEIWSYRIYLQRPLIIVYFGVSRGTRCIKVIWSLLQHSYFIYVSCKSFGKAKRTHRLVWAFATCRCKKIQHVMCWPIYSTTWVIIKISLWTFDLFSYSVWKFEQLRFRTSSERIYLEWSVSLLSTLIPNLEMPFSRTA